MEVSSSGTHAMLRAAEKGTSCIKKKTNNINNRCWFFIYSKTKCSSQYLAILWDAIVKAIWIKKSISGLLYQALEVSEIEESEPIKQ